MRLRNISSFCFLTLFLSAYFFNVKFGFLNFRTFYFAILAIIFLGILGHIRYKKLSRNLVIVVIPLYAAVILAVYSFLANSPDADYFLGGAFWILANVGLSSFGFFNYFSKIEGQPLLGAVIAALTLNAILMIVMFVSSNFQLGYLSLLTSDSYEIFGGSENALDSMYRFRMIGATGFASYSSGFMQAIGLFFLATYYYITEKKPDLLFLTVSVLLAISAVLSARSSLFGIFLWVVFCFIFFRWRFVFIFSCSFIFLVIILFALITQMDADGADFFTNWLLDFFISGTSSDSLSETIEMLDVTFMDSGFYGFSRWYGDLGYDYFRSADVGFIRLILAGGFGALFFVILHFLLMGLFFFRKNSSAFLSTLYIFLMIYFFVIMFKGAILFDFLAFDFLMLMLCWISSQTKELVESK